MIGRAIQETVTIFNESAIYILFGFLIAGILKVTISPEKIFKHLGSKNFGSVFLASLLGIPLPLCSCAVLPTAVSLRKNGASKGATISFLISTPETGIDSITITYALIDPIMTICRPVSALITALIAGAITNHFDKKELEANIEEVKEKNACEEVCSCETHAHGLSGGGKLKEIFHYAFVELLNDIVFWLVIGIVIAGFVSAILPDNFFEAYLGSGPLSMFVMLAIGVPIYMCAASSTPVAAAFILKGLNPGAALVFLLAGPATNVGAIAAVGKFWGRKTMFIYLGTIAVVSVYLGFMLNMLYAGLNINPAASLGQAAGLIPASLKMTGSFALLFLVIRNLWNIGFENALRSLNDKLNDFTGFRIKLSKKYLDPVLKSKDIFVKVLPLIVIALYFLSGFNTIQPGETGILKCFGKVVRKDIGPGLLYALPYPIDSLTRVRSPFVRSLAFGTSNREKIEDTGIEEPASLTGDENLVDARFTVHYAINNAYNYLFSAADNDRVIEFYASSAIIEAIGGEEINNILTTGKDEIQEKIKGILQTRLDTYSAGITILSVQLVYGHSPSSVHFASRDVASSAEDKNTKINEALRYMVNSVSTARGEAQKILLDAEAYKVEKTNSAKGEAEAFLKKAEAFKGSKEVTKTRMYIETMEKSLPGLNKIIKPSLPGQKYDFWFLNDKKSEGVKDRSPLEGTQ
jgi:HflK protein